MKLSSPLVNVNLRPCAISAPHAHGPGSTCAGKPTCVLCPLPSSVRFTPVSNARDCRCSAPGHSLTCPARRRALTALVRGSTWAESLVSDAYHPARNAAGFITHDEETTSEERTACVAFWGFIKSLVLGHSLADCPEAVRNLGAQRDAVFRGLAEVALAAESALAAQQRVDEAFPFESYNLSPASDHRREPRPATVRLKAFIAHLIAELSEEV